MHLPGSIFREIVNFTPLVAIDVIIIKNDKILLGKRKNRPARDYLFVPGGRILKSELMEDAFSRICSKELGVKLKLNHQKLLGVFEHHYEDSIFENVSTHYVVAGYLIENFEGEIKSDNQHESLEWYDINQDNDLIHQYTKDYIKLIRS